MRERDRDGRTIKSIIKDSTDRELSKLSMPEMTPDMLRGMAKSAEKKKLRRYRKIAGAAAALVIVAVGVALVFNSLSTDVEADKNAKHEVVTEDGIIIEDEGWGSSSGVCQTITEKSDINIIKEEMTNLLIPKYVPSNYLFAHLTIDKLENTCDFEYMFYDHDNCELIIHEHIQNENMSAMYVRNVKNTVMCSKGKIYFQNGEEKNKATIKFDDGITVDIWSNLSNDEVIKIIENLSY